MRKGEVFWGAALILLGLVFLLGTTLEVNIWRFVWPLFLILLGAWILWSVATGGDAVETTHEAIPTEGARQARLTIKYGAGRLSLGGSASPGHLLDGHFGGGLEHQTRKRDDTLHVQASVPSRNWTYFLSPWRWGMGGALDWDVHLSEEVILHLNLETGAGQTDLDLTDLQATSLRWNTGASSNRLALPARVSAFQGRVEMGAASLQVQVPPGVAARIQVEGALCEVTVDTERFPRAGKVYQSPDYDQAQARADLHIQCGAGSVQVG